MNFTGTEASGGLAIALVVARLIAHWRALREPGSSRAALLSGLALLSSASTLLYANGIPADRLLLVAAWANLFTSALAFAPCVRSSRAISRLRLRSEGCGDA